MLLQETEEFSSKHPLGGSQSFLTSLPKDEMPLSDFCSHCIHVVYIHRCRQKTHAHTVDKSKKFVKIILALLIS